MSDDELTPSDEDLEAHGAKEVISVGLAAAAFLGAGQTARGAEATAATGERIEQVVAGGDLRAADLDLDGLLSADELATVGLKMNVDELVAGGDDVTPEWVAQNYRVSLGSIGGDGFVTKVDAIVLKRGVDENLDAVLDGETVEWPHKYTALDLDLDGYTTLGELESVGFKWNVDALVDSGHDVTAESLDAAGYKLGLDEIGGDGFAVELDSIMLKPQSDPYLDAILAGEKVDWPSKYTG